MFEALYETRSVSRAGERLGLSQSATSHALARLREACRDELFLRTPQAMVPTPVAHRIFPDVHTALDSLRQSVEEARGFDPATSTRRFEISIPHPLGPAYACAFGTRQRRKRLASGSASTRARWRTTRPT